MGQANSGANHFSHIGQNSVLWPHLIVRTVGNVVCLYAQEKKGFGIYRAVFVSGKILHNLYSHSHALLCF